MGKKVMIALNTTWNLVNFRAALMTAMQELGYEVLAISPPDEYVGRLQALGCEYIPIQMDNKGTNVLEDLKLCWRFFKVLKKYRPDMLFTYTIKPNIYFSLVAHLFNIPVVNTVTGLGTAYLKENMLLHVVNMLYRLAFHRSQKVLFQNEEDLNLFLAKKLVSKNIAKRVPGSGVNLEKFYLQENKRSSHHIFQFLFVGRVIADKGVFELYDAVHILREQGYQFRVCILGFLDVENVGAVTTEQMNDWVSQGVFEYLGSTDDIRSFMQNADAIVLPSYREGLSKALLEACAMGKAIITTDAIGCRDLVEDGVNGYLCQIKSAVDLALKMEKLLLKDLDEVHEMGRCGRIKIEKEYDEKILINIYLQELKTIESKEFLF
jgi:glycosyltransferase involved in cell wall biosynthesis